MVQSFDSWLVQNNVWPLTVFAFWPLTLLLTTVVCSNYKRLWSDTSLYCHKCLWHYSTCSDIHFSFVNSMTILLIMYCKFVWPNSVWLDRHLRKLTWKCLMTGHYHKLLFVYNACIAGACVVGQWAILMNVCMYASTYVYTCVHAYCLSSVIWIENVVTYYIFCQYIAT